MKGLAKGLGARGRTTKLAGAAAALLFLAPVPAMGFTFLSLWSFNILTLNAPAPKVTTSDFAGGTNLVVDMGKTPVVNGGLNRGSVSFFTAQRDISVGPSGETVNVLRSYQTLLQGASLQSIVYFAKTSGGTPGSNVDVLPNVFQTSGPRFGNVYPFPEGSPVSVNLGPGDYTVFVRLKYKKDRFGIWDNSQGLPGSPHTFTISSAVGP